MLKSLLALLSGVIFGLGLIIAGMANPFNLAAGGGCAQAPAHHQAMAFLVRRIKNHCCAMDITLLTSQ